MSPKFSKVYAALSEVLYTVSFLKPFNKSVPRCMFAHSLLLPRHVESSSICMLQFFRPLITSNFVQIYICKENAYVPSIPVKGRCMHVSGEGSGRGEIKSPELRNDLRVLYAMNVKVGPPRRISLIIHREKSFWRKSFSGSIISMTSHCESGFVPTDTNYLRYLATY